MEEPTELFATHRYVLKFSTLVSSVKKLCNPIFSMLSSIVSFSFFTFHVKSTSEGFAVAVQINTILPLTSVCVMPHSGLSETIFLWHYQWDCRERWILLVLVNSTNVYNNIWKHYASSSLIESFSDLVKPFLLSDTNQDLLRKIIVWEKTKSEMHKIYQLYCHVKSMFKNDNV